MKFKITTKSPGYMQTEHIATLEEILVSLMGDVSIERVEEESARYVPSENGKTSYWYDNIPSEGVLCEVWDNEDDDHFFMIVKNYSNEHDMYNTEDYEWYDNARPLTLEEVKKYILK